VFVQLQRTIVKHQAAILAAIEHGLANGLIELAHTRIRLVTPTAFGFYSSQALTSLVMVILDGHRPTFPGRHDPPTRQTSLSGLGQSPSAACFLGTRRGAWETAICCGSEGDKRRDNRRGTIHA
jgi:Transposase